MRTQTILNQITDYKGFIFTTDKFINDPNNKRIEVTIRHRKNSKGLCSKCHQVAPGYDTQPQREFQFIPVWNIPVIFLYPPRRVSCPEHGVVIEHMPWSNGKSPITLPFMWFLSAWAKLLSWQQVARSFNVNWVQVYESVSMAVEWGRNHMDLNGITAIGVDEVYCFKNKFMTVVYQINKGVKRLLYISEDRTEASFRGFFEWFGTDNSKLIEYVCSDMWRPFLKVIKEKCVNAVNILDRYHVVAKLNKALDEIRASEHKTIQKDGTISILKNSRWCLLKRPENLTDTQSIKLKELLACNLKTIRGYLLKEELDFFWKYVSVACAKKFLKKWTTKVMRSRLEPMKKVAKTIRNHEDLILNWFSARNHISLGAVEGLNNKIKSVTKRSYGFRNPEVLKIAMYHALGNLTTPKFTHIF